MSCFARIVGPLSNPAQGSGFFYFFNFLQGGVVVKELRYKAAGRGFDSRWCHWNISVT